MSDFYGVRATESKATAGTAIKADCAPMVFGTAPVHQTGGKANTVVLANSFEEAVAALGWSDDWEKYTLCEAIWCQFKLYKVAPLLLVNVLAPDAYRTGAETKEYPVSGGQVTLSGDTLPNTVEVKDGETVCERGKDYDLFFTEGTCVIEALPGGSLEEAKSLNVTCSRVEFEREQLRDALIGGYDLSTGSSRGLELADQAYFRTRLLPDTLLAPGFSQDPEVAAVLAAKARSFSVVLRSFALCDLETGTKLDLGGVEEQKRGCLSFRGEKQRLCWPMVEKDGRRFHLSTHMAGLMSRLTAENGGVPSEPASNKPLEADSVVLSDGGEAVLDLAQANYLRGLGVTTAFNFINGPSAWGEYCACVPDNAEAKDRYCNVARMVNYISNTVILTYWSYADRKMTPRLAESIADGVSVWLNGLSAQEHLAGGRCELVAAENPVEDLTAGIVRPHIYLGASGPSQAIDFIVEYDESYVKNLWADWRS